MTARDGRLWRAQSARTCRRACLIMALDWVVWRVPAVAPGVVSQGPLRNPRKGAPRSGARAGDLIFLLKASPQWRVASPRSKIAPESVRLTHARERVVSGGWWFNKPRFDAMPYLAYPVFCVSWMFGEEGRREGCAAKARSLGDDDGCLRPPYVIPTFEVFSLIEVGVVVCAML